MSKGTKRRRSRPTATSSQGSDRQLWIIAPEEARESKEQAEIRQRALDVATVHGIAAVTRRTKRCVIEGGPDAHKRFELLEPRDAGDLYHAMHRRAVLIVAVTACSVRLDPAENPTRYRHARPLEEYVRYKALYGLARAVGDLPGILSRFLNWPPAGSRSELQDPRILPLHVFDNVRLWSGLDNPTGIALFSSTYGHAQRRSDSAGRIWSPDPARHGNDTLTISGFTLPTGFHWDVKRGQGGERLVTCHEIWKLDRCGSHANIYPDAYVRISRKEGRRVWP